MTKSEKFWSKVDRSGECWIWMGGLNPSGYGVFYYQNTKILAHRFAFAEANGEIGGGLIVCHHCDVRPCVRPSHLFSGTHEDNRHDAIAKGRMVGRKRISVASVDEMRSQIVQLQRAVEKAAIEKPVRNSLKREQYEKALLKVIRSRNLEEARRIAIEAINRFR